MRPEHWFYTIPLRLRSLFRRNSVEQELDEELRDHLEHLVEEYVSRGMKPKEARNLALRAMGGVEQQKEQCRTMRRVNILENLIQDIRYGFRVLKKNPGFVAAAILTLALGVGANVAVFAVVEAVLLRRAGQALLQGTKSDQARGEPLLEWLNHDAELRASRFDICKEIYLKKESDFLGKKRRKSFVHIMKLIIIILSLPLLTNINVNTLHQKMFITLK